MTRAEELELIGKEAENYAPEDFELYVAEAGWQDWMNEYLSEDRDTEDSLSPQTVRDITEVQAEGFKKAHPDYIFNMLKYPEGKIVLQVKEY